MAGAALFVLGFAALFTSYGVLFGGIGERLLAHEQGVTRILGGVTIVLGLMFAGVFDRFTLTGRIVRPSWRPRAGLAGAPLLGVMFGLTWTPCVGPTLSAVLLMAGTTGTAARGALLAFCYGIGIGIPFLIVAFAFRRGMNVFGFARRHGRLITAAGGMMLVAVGLLEVTGTWGTAMIWLKIHWIGNYQSPL
jgi:cytochrome c-type biogenesis protein